MKTHQKKIIYLALFLSGVIGFSSGCSKKTETSAVLKIENLEVSSTEFEHAFQESQFLKTPEARRVFVEHFINQKLILLEAEKEGITQSPEFLAELQEFVNQKLMQKLVEKKEQEFEKKVSVSEKNILNFYSDNKEKLFASQDYSAVRDQIHQMLVLEQRKKLFVDWLSELRESSNILVQEAKLGF